MGRTIVVPDEVYDEIQEEASASGTTPAGWVAAKLPSKARAGSSEAEGPPRKSLAERLVGRVGLVHSGRGDLSERHSELFTEGMVEKRRLGNL